WRGMSRWRRPGLPVACPAAATSAIRSEPGEPDLPLQALACARDTGAERYLLRDAMNAAATEQDLARLYADHTPLRKEFLQLSRRHLVALRIEQRHHDARVADVGIHVGRSQTFPRRARL